MKYKLLIFFYIEKTDTPIPVDSFADRLEAIEEKLRTLIKTPEYQQMLQSGYNNRVDLSLGDALLAVQECFNEYYVNEVCLDSKQ